MMLSAIVDGSIVEKELRQSLEGLKVEFPSVDMTSQTV